ncbi:uncharacterized protein LOC124160837 isoform X2 [Ischnura elegans]|uniref:uncharacterized protein LOC124160837 isoform X2 n=1 Tax=Ischnura elegans TaxID=197161 RepID=UPI001ED89B43|nr:uncharacterized protein LOC124160837 isoform X2 [Ischnura elegans]
MEALLPSEVSRLILGYLEEQSCTAAYQTFLETCPHLKECAEAAQLGLRFSTRAAGKSLRDILNEYCLIYTIVQERIQKLPDSTASQLKAYGVSLADQVKQLIDGKQTGQRFHVNITVPSQLKSSKPRHGGSGTTNSPATSHHMVTPTSSRMRRSSHPIQEQRLTLRSQDPKEDVTASVTVQRVETTQLENLPGSSITPPPRRASLSGSRDQRDSENAANDEAEEENSSLLDPKTGELISPAVLHQDSRPPAKDSASAESKTVETNTSVPCALSLRQSVGPIDSASETVLNRTLAESQAVQNESGSGRTSLDSMLINILAAHETGVGTSLHEKSASSVSNANVTALRSSGGFVTTPVESGASEPSTSQSAVPTMGAPSLNQEKNVPSVLATPNPKLPPKSHEMEVATPRRSAAKRKTKPTPLKMMTPLKIKVGGEVSDSPDVKINPKLIYGPLLEKRELHERIAENINQYIRPSTTEDATEKRNVETADASTDALLSISADGKLQPCKDSSTQEELERVIRSVVDKTESDPLFESLLNDILGPECNEDSMMDSIVEERTTQDETSNGNPGSNDTVPPEGGQKDPVSILEDQNEAAIKSILEAQPLMKDTPNPKQEKAPVKPQQKPRPVPIAPKEPVIVPGNPPFILTKINPEDAKNMSVGPCENMAYPGRELPPLHTIDLTNHPEAIQPLPVVDPSEIRVEPLGLGIENVANETVATECPSDALIIDSTCNQGATPDVLASRPSRSATEGQQKNVEKEGDTPMMASVKPRASMSTPRRRSRGHIRALDFGSTPPKPLPSASQDSVSKVMTSTPFEAASKFVGPQTVARKELSKRLGGPGTRELPDLSTTCIATRSPPPPLSGAWNKVGVDLIFGCDTSPTSEHTSPPSASHGAPEGSKESQEGSKDGAKSSTISVSPKAKLKGDAWDAALRAQIGIGDEAKKMSREQMQALARAEREKKKLEMQKRREEAKRIAEEAKRKKREEKEAKKAKWAEAKALRKSKGSAKGQKKNVEELIMPSLQDGDSSSVEETTSVVKDVDEREAEKEKDAPSVSPTQEASVPVRTSVSNEEAVEGDPEPFGEKRKRNSWSEVPPKKKAATDVREPQESESHNVMPSETVMSPEKNRVVQQSPGSLANKRSLLGQSVDSGESKFTGNFTARRCLDLHETPRKPEQSSVIERVSQKSGGNNLSTGADRTTLTVVDTPLFPPTPGMCVIGTPHREDSGEAVEAFPSYFKPREKDAPSGKEKPVEDVSSEKVSAQDPLPESLTGDSVDKESVEKGVVTPPKSKRGESGGSNARTSNDDLSKSKDHDPLESDPGKSNDVLSESEKSDNPVEKDARVSEDALVKSKAVETVKNDVRKSIGALSNSKDGDSMELNITQGGDAVEGPEESGKDVGKSSCPEKDLLKDNNAEEIPAASGKKTAKTRRLPAKKTKTPPARPKPPGKSKKEKSIVEEEDRSDSEKEFEDEVLPTRVLRPRKKTSYFKDESGKVEEKTDDVTNPEPRKSAARKKSSLRMNAEESPRYEDKKDDASNVEASTAVAKKKSAPRRKKKASSPEPCTDVAEDEIEEGLVFTPLAPEVVMNQSHEAELLAKQIKLKLSPSAPKSCDFEEEEDDGDSDITISSPKGKIQKAAEQKVDGGPENDRLKRPDSVASDHSSSSESSSSDSSDEEEGNHDDALQSEVVAPRSGQAVMEASNSDKSIEKRSTEEVVGGEAFPENGQLRKLLDEGAKKPTASPVENESAEKSDGKQIHAHWNMGNNTEPVKSPGNKLESEKLCSSQNIKVPESKDMSKGTLLLSEKKKRRDNLEKILFGRDSNDADESSKIVETRSTILPIVDHSLVTELEMKKQRTLERLRGGRTSLSPGAAVGSGFNSSSSTVKSTPSPSVSPNVLPLTPTGKKVGSVGARKSPRKSLPVKESSKLAIIFDEEEDEFQDDCPELRLSEGECDFDSPNQIISPGKFELLASVEDKLALLHGDLSPTVVKKTARMSCTPAPNAGEGLKAKETLKSPCTEPTRVSSAPDSKSNQVGNQSLPQVELEPIASTSKAAELRHKAEERKHRALSNALEASNRTSGITVRKKRPLRSNQLGAGNDDLFGDDECVEDNEKSSLGPLNDNKEKVGGMPEKGKSKASEKAVTKFMERNTKRGVRVNKNSAEMEVTAMHPSTHSVCNSDSSGKQNRRQKKRSVDDSAVLEKGNPKPTRSRRKSGHPLLHTSEAGLNLILDEDELTRDGFTENMNEKSCGPVNSADVELNFKEISKNSMLNEKQKQKLEDIEPSKDAKSGGKPQKNIAFVVARGKSSEKDIGANRGSSSPPPLKMQTCRLEPLTLDVNQVTKKGNNDVRQLSSISKVPKGKSSKNDDKPTQAKLPCRDDGGKYAVLVAPSDKVALSLSSGNKSTKKAAGNVEGARVSGDLGNDDAEPRPQSKEQVHHEDVRDTVCSSRQSSSSDTSEAPSADDATSDSTEENCGVCPEAPAEGAVNNLSLVGPSDMSFSSNEVLIHIMYDEDNPPPPTTSILDSQLGPPLSPSAPELEGLTVDLGGEVVNIVISDYIELLSITPKEIKSHISRGIRGRVISAIMSGSKKSKNDKDDKKVAVSRKKGDESEEGCGGATESSLCSDRKRKLTDEAESVKGEVPSKFCRPSRRKEKDAPSRNSVHTNSVSDKDMASIQRVVDACNDSNENSVDDDSLMTYAAIGACSGENQNKEDGGRRKFLPLKKRRTTADDKPSQPSGDGDVVNSNPGIFFPLNVMEIEDFLSKVHGEAS